MRWGDAIGQEASFKLIDMGEGYNLGQRIITISLQACPMSNFSKLTVENEPNQKSNNQSMIKSDKKRKEKRRD